MIKIDKDFKIENWYDKEIDFEDLKILQQYASSHTPKIPISFEIGYNTDKSCYYILRRRIE